MSVRKVHISFRTSTFDEIRSAAKQTNLPISSYLVQVVEADLAGRRLAGPPLPKSGKDADPQRPATALHRFA